VTASVVGSRKDANAGIPEKLPAVGCRRRSRSHREESINPAGSCSARNAPRRESRVPILQERALLWKVKEIGDICEQRGLRRVRASAATFSVRARAAFTSRTHPRGLRERYEASPNARVFEWPFRVIDEATRNEMQEGKRGNGRCIPLRLCLLVVLFPELPAVRRRAYDNLVCY